MSEHQLDEFDKKAKKFLKEGNRKRLKNILREFALCEGYENDLELENPEKILIEAAIKVENIDDFTEYRVAKGLIKKQIEKRAENGWLKLSRFTG